MPVELFLSPIMRPIVKAQSLIMGYHRTNSFYTPIIVNLLENPDDCRSFVVRREFGTGSKTYAVLENDGKAHTYADKLYHLTRSRAVKGSYKLYAKGDEKPVGAIRAGLRSNFVLYRLSDGSELELGWHNVHHLVDALDDYRMLELGDGATYHWTFKGRFLERVRNPGEKEAEVRERVGHVKVHPNRQGFDLVFNKNIIIPEVAICSAMICYVEAWNTWRAYGGIYLAEQHQPTLPWSRS